MVDPINKKYRLRNGWEWRYYGKGGGKYLIHGAYKHPEYGWTVATWDENGLEGTVSYFNLVEIPQEHVIKGWLVRWKIGYIHYYKEDPREKLLFDIKTLNNVAAINPIEIISRDGDGLEDRE